MVFKHLGVISLIFLLSIPLSNAESKDTTYTWKECLDLAIKNNPELSAALSQVQSSEFGKTAKRSNFLPTISATLSKTKNVSQTQGASTYSSNRYLASLNASINLFNGLKDYNLLSQAQAGIEVSKAQYVKTSAQILYNLKSAFMNYSYAIENTKLTKKILRRRQENLKLVNLRYEGGLENKGSELLSEAYLSQAKYDLLVAEQSLMTSQSQLAQVMGLDTNTPIKISGTLETLDPPSRDNPPDFETLARSTPTYLEALSQEKYYKKSVAMAKSTFSPTLNVTGGVSQNGSTFMGNTNTGSSVGVSLNFPLFNGGNDYYGIKAANANYAQRRSTRINTGRAVAVDLRNKFVQFIQAVQLYKTNTLFRKAAEVRADIARGKYNNGLLTFNNWVIIENDLISRQKSYLTSYRSRVLAEASWYQTLGKGISQ